MFRVDKYIPKTVLLLSAIEKLKKPVPHPISMISESGSINLMICAKSSL
jgi:hypothetical protein